MIWCYLIIALCLLFPAHATECRVTSYGPECGSLTASGHRIDWAAVERGEERTCAVSRAAEKLYPQGSLIYVSGHGFWWVRDRTAVWL